MSFSPEEKRLIKEAAKNYEKQKKAWANDKIEVFEQLLRLKEFTEWANDNIVVNRDIDHLSQEVRILVIYKGGHPNNKTSLQKLGEIKELVEKADDETDKYELISDILEIIDYDVVDTLTDEEEKEDEEAN